MANFKPRKTRKNFDIFSSFDYFTPGWNGIAWITLWFLVGALIGNIITIPVMALFGDIEDGSIYATVIAYPIMFIPPMLYASYKSRSNSFFGTGYKLSNDVYKPLGGLFCAIAVVFATLALAFVADLLSSVMPPMPEALEKALKGMTGGNIWVNLLCVSIFAPFFEEWLCRGMVLRGLLNFEHKDKATGEMKRGIKPLWAVVASAAFFAIIHMNPWQAIPAFLMGCLFGYVYWRTGSIKLTMLMHCANNTFAVVMSNIDSLEDAEFMRDILPTAPYVAIYVLCIAILLYVVSKFRTVETLSPQGNCGRLSAE